MTTVDDWMTRYEFRVRQKMVEFPDWRHGQAYFNVLADLDPVIAMGVFGEWCDPFHDDTQIPKFLAYVRKAIATEGSSEHYGQR